MHVLGCVICKDEEWDEFTSIWFALDEVTAVNSLKKKKKKVEMKKKGRTEVGREYEVRGEASVCIV